MTTNMQIAWVAILSSVSLYNENKVSISQSIIKKI